MSVIVPPSTLSLLPPSLPVRRFTVDEYHRMIQAGILTEDDAVELLEGLVVPKMPRNPTHDGTIEIVAEAVRCRLPAGWRVRGQSAITTMDSEPEPDVAVVPGSVRSHLQHHPGPQEIGLLIEVSDATLARDRNEKARMYARAGIVCYWIINLIDRQVEVHTDPTGPGPNPVYRQRQVYAGATSVPLVIGGQEVAQIPVSELLP
jgi:Uma2 family endonuclease